MKSSCYVPVIAVPEPEMNGKIASLGKLGIYLVIKSLGFWFNNEALDTVSTTSGETTPFLRANCWTRDSAAIQVFNCGDSIFKTLSDINDIPNYISVEHFSDALGQTRFYYLSESDCMFFWQTGYLKESTINDRFVKKLVLSPILISVEIVPPSNIVIRSLPAILSMYGSPRRTTPAGISKFLESLLFAGHVSKESSLPSYLHRFLSDNPEAPLKIPRKPKEEPE